MSQADELLDNLSDDDIVAYSASQADKPHIIIGNDRQITVPDELKKIAVQHDHNIETVTFDCPRYWGEYDLSTMVILINYQRFDLGKGSYRAENITVDDSDDSIIHFTWTLTRNATMSAGKLTILVCASLVNSDGNEEAHWNSDLNTDLYISPGMDCNEGIEESYPDVIIRLITDVDTLKRTSASGITASVNADGVLVVTQG